MNDLNNTNCNEDGSYSIICNTDSENSLRTEIINSHLKQHQLNVDWDKRDLIQNLHLWTERFIFEFKLKINELPALMVDKISRRRYGHHRAGRNGFGLRNEVAINEIYIEKISYSDVLGTLLHELLHVEQDQFGEPGKHNYHNKEFRDRAASFGLLIDGWGHTTYAPAPSPFWSILTKYSVKVPETSVDIVQTAHEPGQSKLRLWICECHPQPVRVRVAITDFRAMCLKCGAIFRSAY